MAIIFALREEYFLQFLCNFNINFLNGEEPKADLKGILSYKKYFTGKNRIGTWDNNILVCQGETKETNEMPRLCEQAFGKDGETIYNHFKDVPLIQQQIVFNIIEQEKDQITSDEYEKCDMNYMMQRYFDVQLCSTKDFFNTSKIMYLLSVGRVEGIDFTSDDLIAALCIFGDNERKIFMTV